MFLSPKPPDLSLKQLFFASLSLLYGSEWLSEMLCSQRSYIPWSVDEDAEEESVEGLAEYRDTALPEALLGSTSVVQNPDPAVLETLSELNQLLGGSHMRTVNQWLRVLTQVQHLICVAPTP